MKIFSLNTFIATLSVLVVVLMATADPAQAQRYYKSTEYGVGVGVSQYFGDLNPNYGFKHIRPAYAALYKKNFNPYISLSGTATYTDVGYKDAYSPIEYQRQRNLSFTSSIIEVAAMGEFNFFWFETGDKQRRVTPFLTLGVAGFYYNPMVVYNSKAYSLKDLGTEGQNTAAYKDRKYSNFGIAFPVGAGVKWWLSPGVNMSFHVLNRFTVNDYIDDVSQTYVGVDRFEQVPGVPTISSILQDPSARMDGLKMGQAGNKRGDASTKDQYLIAQLSITFQLKTYKCPKLESGLWDGTEVSY